MKRALSTLSGVLLILTPAVALAEGAGGGYKGIAQIYYSIISALLIYGVHDTFHNRNITIAGAVIIVGVMFGVLLPKN